jgi:hypothetical protein
LFPLLGKLCLLSQSIDFELLLKRVLPDSLFPFPQIKKINQFLSEKPLLFSSSLKRRYVG